MRGVLVGRGRELAALAGYLDDARRGRPSIVLCRGEPGIGKTRLAEELAGLAGDRGMPALWGVAVESEGAPPYWPWRQLLRGAVELVGIAGVDADLGRLVPEVFGGPASTPDALASAEDRFRQFEAVARLFREITANSPLVLILDDAHWADRPSVLLLRHLARTMRDERLLMMVNHRDTEHEHAGYFADLVREPITRQIDLTGLTEQAVAMHLASVLGHDVTLGDARRVHVLTGGNPFFVGEVGRVLPAGKVAGGLAPVTANVREAIRSRLSRLSPDAVTLIHAASIVGREFSATVVAPMVGATSMSCLSSLDEATAAGLVEAGTIPGNHRFTHALVRDAVEAGLSTAERVQLHRAAAETVESVHAGRTERYLSDLARHWAVAAVDGDLSRAVHWITLAADEAMEALAYEEGARLYRLALSLGEDELDDEMRCRLYLGLSSALNASTDIAGSVDASVRAAAAAGAMARPSLLAEAALVREANAPTPLEATTRRLCEQALAVVDRADIALRARLLARLAEASIYDAWGTSHGYEEYDVAGRASEEALTLAEEAGDRAALEAALRARRLARSGPEGLEERAVLADRMLELGREAADPHTQMWAHLWHVDAAFERGDLVRVAGELEMLSWCVEQVRGPHARYELLKCRAVLAQAQARFADAMMLADEAFAQLAATGDDIGFHERAGLLNQMSLQIGPEATGALEASGYAGVTVFERQLPTAGIIIAVANAHLLASVGRLDEAGAVYRSLGPPAEWQPSPHAILPALAFGANLAVELGADEDVATLVTRLGAYRGHHVCSGAGQVAYFGPVELWTGHCLARLGRLDEAVADLEAAADICAANGAVGYLAEAQYELASALARRRRSGDIAWARYLLAAGLRHTSALGMGVIAAKVDALVEELSAAGPLTRREWQVAGLVAAGKTNREIAQELYLSERTAQNHVQHVLTKLGLSNRSQIASWVAHQEMSSPTE
ncbi:ATP-binding protein [Kribbella sp. NPDC056951]|uniref:ATP-binding protein n=1 Tax=Kribbella sp. NPDC056951 TaxID=3345978 RepID=UPI003636C519